MHWVTGTDNVELSIFFHMLVVKLSNKSLRQQQNKKEDGKREGERLRRQQTRKHSNIDLS